MRQIKKDSTNISVEIYIVDDTDGTPETGVVFDTAGIDLNYRRDSAAVVSITEIDLTTPALTDAHEDGGFLHVSNGRYRLDVPDAAVATGVSQVTIGGTVTGMVVLPITIQLVDFDPDDAVRMGLTALPNAIAEAAGGLYTRGTGAGQINQDADGRFDANIAAVSQDSVAADNLELMFDGSGYVDDTAPASRAQVGAIGASAGGALNFEAAEDNSGGTIDPGSTAFVGVETNNFTDTDREDGIYHIIEDTTNVIDVVYGFNIGGGRTASEMVFKGFANANNDDLIISVWDHPGAEWEILGTLSGANSTSNVAVTKTLLSKHTGTGSEIGKVYIRFNGSGLSASADLNTDQILIEAVGIGQSVGYQLGAVWIDTVDGVAGTEDFVNGVADNPVLTLADFITLSTSLNLHRAVIVPGSSITFIEAHTDELWEGRDWTLILNGQNITGAFIFGATSVTGICTATAGYEFEECDLGAVTMDNDGHFERCSLGGTFTIGQAGTFTFHNCFTLSGSEITIDFAAIGATAIHLFQFDGEINFTNMAAGDTVHITGGGTITTTTCTGGTIDHDGFFEYTDAGGNVTEVQSDIKVAVDATLVDTGTDGVVLSAAEDVYHSDIDLSKDDANTIDEYSIIWFKNGARIISGITVPTIQVVKRVDGTDLVASTAMTQIGTTGSYKYNEDTNRITDGEAVIVIVAATIDSGSRSFAHVISRDSS